jgi:membrane-associated protein
LLFAAGILAAKGSLNIYLLMFLLFAAAVIGNSVGYAIGRKFGPKVFNRENSLLFNKKHVTRAEAFFAKHGWKTLILARFVPVVRTFVPVIAGMGKMEYWKFTLHNILGAILWIGSVTLLGFWLGNRIANIELYIIPILVLIILLSISPYLKQLITNAELRQNIYDQLRAIKKRLIKK